MNLAKHNLSFETITKMPLILLMIGMPVLINGIMLPRKEAGDA